jgi:hypothetical protein
VALAAAYARDTRSARSVAHSQAPNGFQKGHPTTPTQRGDGLVLPSSVGKLSRPLLSASTPVIMSLPKLPYPNMPLSRTVRTVRQCCLLTEASRGLPNQVPCTKA